MPSTPAEVARTLATGRLLGRLSLPAVPDDLPVAHATTSDGVVLVAARRDSCAWLTLMVGGAGPVTLTVADQPPFPDSPPLGRLRLSGSVRRVGGDDERGAAVAFAEANPTDELLDVGHGLDLFRLDPVDLRLERAGVVIHLAPDQFTGARPDPLHIDERDLLADLRDHHADELAALVPGSPEMIMPVRLDRYGLTIALPTLARLEFTRPAQGPCCVARALRLNHAGH